MVKLLIKFEKFESKKKQKRILCLFAMLLKVLTTAWEVSHNIANKHSMRFCFFSIQISQT